MVFSALSGIEHLTFLVGKEDLTLALIRHPSQVTLDHFVMVRIHARQRVLHQELTPFIENALISILATS